MGSLGDGVKKVLLAGIGTAAVTAEKSKEVLDKMAERGEAAVEQGKVLNQELRHNIKMAAGQVDVNDALLRLKMEPFEELGFAKLDSHRGLRQGVAEVIYGAGKTPEQIARIVDAMRSGGQDTILITRMSDEAAAAIDPAHPFTYYEMGRIGIVGSLPSPDGSGKVVVATGGTSDMPVAEEAALTAEALGNEVVRLYDVGVAGPVF